MGDERQVEAADVVTRQGLAAAFAELGLPGYEAVMVHASLSAFGWVCGGAQSVVEALLAAAGPGCTVVFPAFSGDWTDPAGWRSPAVAPSAVALVRAAMPPFDPRLSPTRGMGRIAECFRTHGAARRSPHPQVSLSAVGPAAGRIAAAHSVERRFGEGSPLAVLDRMNSAILFLGTDFRRCTALHLAEYRSAYPGQAQVRRAVPAWNGEATEWLEVDDVALVEDDFPEIGAHCVATIPHRAARIGRADCLLIPFPQVVAAATAWMNRRVVTDPKIVR
jgi:aminoglycoside 3-N-acetyltransferase